MNITVGIFCACVSVLGLCGTLMGLGYIVNKRQRLTNEPEEHHLQMLKRESKTGWACIIAGAAVAIGGIVLYFVVMHFLNLLEAIKAATQ